MLVFVVAMWSGAAVAQPLALAPADDPGPIFRDILGDQDAQIDIDQGAAPADNDRPSLPASLRRQIVDYPTSEAPGTVIVDTPHTYLYYVLAGGKAVRYGIGVGREGFTWSGVRTIERKSEWPDWIPPAEMIERQPYLPRFMAGGLGNPLGARAIYVGGTLYRIHGTNQPSSIGKRVSSGCIRMLNEDVIDLYGRVNIGTKIVVRPDNRGHAAASGISGHVPSQAASSQIPSTVRPRMMSAARGAGHVAAPPVQGSSRTALY